MSEDNEDAGVDPIEYSCLHQNVANFCQDDLEKQIEALKASNNGIEDSNDSVNVPVVSSVKVADFASEVFFKESSEALNLKYVSNTKSNDDFNGLEEEQAHSTIDEIPRIATSSAQFSDSSLANVTHPTISSQSSRGIRRSRSLHRRGQTSASQEDRRKRKVLKEANWDKRNNKVSLFRIEIIISNL